MSTPSARTLTITHLCEPRGPVPLAVGLQVAAGIGGFVYQAEQLDTLWETDNAAL